MAVDNGAPIKNKYINSIIFLSQYKILNISANVINDPSGNISTIGFVSINVIKYNIPIVI